MAEIRNFAFVRHFRTDPTLHVLRYRGGAVKQSGKGITFWFLPMSTSIAEVPLDDRELVLMVRAPSSDYQDVTVQGVVTFRVTQPERLAERVDFTVDLGSGLYTKQPIEKLTLLITQIAQQFAAAYVTAQPVKKILVEGYDRIRELVRQGLDGDAGLTDMGIEIVSVRVASIKPTSELQKALEMPMREKIQQEADEATFARRALAVEKERAIQENELQNQIELAKREKQLIDERGRNELQRVEQENEEKRVESEARAQRTRVDANAQADSVRILEQVKVHAERERMDVYRDLPRSVLLGLAAQELAGKLQRIDHLNISPEMFGPLLNDLILAGTKKLETPGEAQ